MKHYFIINPAAGQGGAAGLRQHIYDISKAKGIEFGIYMSKAPGDALEFAKLVTERQEPAAVYACGGDGTLGEVVNGVMEAKSEREADPACGSAADDLYIGCVPCGTGNDFVRNFPDAGDFSDIEAQIAAAEEGRVKTCDLIRYEADGAAFDHETAGSLEAYPEGKKTGYSINMFNIGFDANVVDLTGSMKKMPLIAGPFAYFASVAVTLIKKKGADLRVEFEDGDVYDGKLLLIAVTNGCYCGGGVKGIPEAEVDDGLIDISLVKYASRMDFVKLFPKYKEGTHLYDERAKDLFIYKKAKSLTIKPNGKKMRLCVDGEMMTSGEIGFSICERAIDFVLP